MRRLSTAVVLLALAGSAGAGEPPVTDAEWDRRDMDARWVFYRRAPDAPEEAWIAYAVKRHDWEFLEWLALTSRSGNALLALADADAPNWVRCAKWPAADSHRRQAATGRLDRLKDAGKYLPPWDPEVLLAPLVAPPDLAELGDRRKAEPGKRYVHQVVRAIDVLAESALHGEPWAGRLAALVGHPHSGVRRAACLAYGSRPPDEVPLAALEVRASDEAETPAVRAAAVLGLSYAESPAAYGVLLGVATTPAHPAWRAAVSRLGDLDDGFALEVWKGLDVAAAGADAKAFLAAQADRIRARVAATDGAALASRVVPMLERAASMDLSCGPFEGTFVSWSLLAVHARRGEPEVRGALEQAKEAYESPHAERGLADPLRDRVRAYARSVLEEDEASLRAR